MANAYLFTLQPTFTQGLVLGQLSILLLLVVILKYLFLDPDQPYKSFSYQPRLIREDDNEKPTLNDIRQQANTASGKADPAADSGVESADWLNILLHQVRLLTSAYVMISI